MNRYHIAVLIFLVGASAANFFTAKQQDDRIGSWAAVSTPQDATAAAWGAPPSPAERAYRASVAREERVIKDAAWMREAMILTICGAALFLVPRKHDDRVGG